MRPDAWKDWVAGLCAGFPPCCVQWWIEVYAAQPILGWPHPDPAMEAHRERLKAGVNGRPWWYIPCPACLDSGRMAEVQHECPNDCRALATMVDAVPCREGTIWATV